MCSVCFPDVAVWQCRITLRAADVVVPAWQIHPGLQSPPPGRGVVNALWWEGTVETQGPDSLFWVFSTTSRAGCFLVCLTAHRHQLTLAAFVRRLTRTQPPVLCFLLSASLDGNNFHLLDGVFWALPHLLSPVLLPYIYIYIASVFLKMWFPELHSPPPTT